MLRLLDLLSGGGVKGKKKDKMRKHKIECIILKYTALNFPHEYI
jgi:hypothetical protein